MIRTGGSSSIRSTGPPPTLEDDFAVVAQPVRNLELDVNHRDFDEERAQRLVTLVEEIIVGRHWSKRR
jgi:hypothetical protein